MVKKKNKEGKKTEPVEFSEPAEDDEKQTEAQKEIVDLKRQVAEKAELAQAYFAQLQRVQADFENFQKRVDAEKSRIADSACESVVAGLLDTLDNFERAIIHLEKLPNEESKGVLMVYKNMLEYLQTNGLERIAAAGCQFDPRKHDAIMMTDFKGAEDGEILEEFQSGYTMKGKVIRPAKVKVARLTEKKNDINNINMEE